MEQNFQVRDVFNEKVVNQLAASLASIWSGFNEKGFSYSINSKLKSLTFSERANLIRDTLREYLPKDYPHALDIILKALPPELPHCEVTGFDNFIILPQNEFVAKYGLEHYDISIQALYEMTKRFSAEGAIRSFILKYPSQTLAILNKWANDENCHVRRLVSEGTRPRLPWTIQLKPFIKNPQPILPLLEKLKTDPELMVLRSVANNLNDISKDNPQIVVKTLKRWKKIDNKGTQWLTKHAARTLVKQGNQDVLSLLGFTSDIKIGVSKIHLNKSRLKIGGDLTFSFTIHSKSKRGQQLVVDYIIYHVRANGTRTPKVFKLSTKELASGQRVEFTKRHSFRPITTRKYYAGKHMVEIQVNGKKYQKAEFELKSAKD